MFTLKCPTEFHGALTPKKLCFNILIFCNAMNTYLEK